RMVAAQAPGVAGTRRRLSPIPVSGDGWPGRLLAEYAQLHLLIRAGGPRDAPPAARAAPVRPRVGFTTGREEVLAGPGVTDHWLVLGRRDLLDAAVPARRIWLRGRDSGRFAVLLLFAPGGTFATGEGTSAGFAAGGGFGGHPDAGLVPGTQLHADLHFYPGQPAMRAVIGARHGEPGPAPQPDETDDVTGLLDRWLAGCPAVVAGVRARDEPRWRFVDGSGRAVPLLGAEPAWPLLAVSGGDPVALAGGWGAGGLSPLCVLDGGRGG